MKRQSAHIDVIDHLRGIAAVMVTWFHLTNGYGASWPASTGYYGWLGVEIFFVISGFVITLSLAAGDRPWSFRLYSEFMIRRIVRLEPPYLASIALTLALLWLSTLSSSFHGSLANPSVPQVLFHLAYLIPFTEYDWLQPIYWSLTYEFIFYLVGGVVIPLLMVGRKSWSFVGCAAVLAFAVLLGWVPPLVMLFVIGVGACRLYLKLDHAGIATLVCLGAALVLIHEGFDVQAGVGLAVGGLLANNARLSPIQGTSGAVLRWLGAISYSLYLIHVPIGGRVVNLGQRWLTTPIEHLSLSIFAFIICCAVATGFWWLIERPSIVAAVRCQAAFRGLRAR